MTTDPTRKPAEVPGTGAERAHRHATPKRRPAAPRHPRPLVHRDGHQVVFLPRPDADEVLEIEHRWPRRGRMAGPHWHPVLQETFAVRRGEMRFRVDGRDVVLGAGDRIVVEPGQVHEFWSTADETLEVRHEVRPPGRHREMFELWHRLDEQGKTTRSGIPRNPLWLATLWDLQDGYLAGVPASLQQGVLGALAGFARRRGAPP